MANKGNPNGEDKKLNFIFKVWDDVADEYRPVYIAPDGTDTVAGDVYLSDEVPDLEDMGEDEKELISAEKGITAATPLAVGTLNSNKVNKTATIDVRSYVEDDDDDYIAGPQSFEDTDEEIKIQIGDLDAKKIKGVINIDNIPQAALERLVTYTDADAARAGYEKGDFQEGDTVRLTEKDKDGNEIDTPVMYFITLGDDDEIEFNEYAAGVAQALASGTVGSPQVPVYFKDGKPVAADDVQGGVTGVKGENEKEFRQGDVELTYNDIGSVGLRKIADETVSHLTLDKDYFWLNSISNSKYCYGVKIESVNFIDLTRYEISNKNISFYGNITDAADEPSIVMQIKTNNAGLQIKDSADNFNIGMSTKKSNSAMSQINVKDIDVSEASDDTFRTFTITLDFDLPSGDISDYNYSFFLRNLFHELTSKYIEEEIDIKTPAIDLGTQELDSADLKQVTTPLVIAGTSFKYVKAQMLNSPEVGIDEPIMTTKGGLLPNGDETNLGALDEPFHDLFIDNVYAGHIYLSEASLGDIDIGDLIIGRAKSVSKTLNFVGDVVGSVDLSTEGDQDVTLTAMSISTPPEIAIQSEEPEDENIKIWIKI